MMIVADSLCLAVADPGGASGSVGSPVWWVTKLRCTGGSGCGLQSCAADHHRQHVLPCNAGCTATGMGRISWNVTEYPLFVLKCRSLCLFLFLFFCLQIFSKFGTVMKIITFTKNNQFQALLQFSDPVNAQQAKLVSSRIPTASTSHIMRLYYSSPTVWFTVCNTKPAEHRLLCV